MPQLIPVQMYQAPKLILRRKLRNQVNLARDWNHQTSQRLYLQNTQLDDQLEVLIEYPVKLSLQRPPERQEKIQVTGHPSM